VYRLAPEEFLRSPEATSRRWTEAEALEYTHWLATHHYENFHVVSWLLPKKLHQDFYNVYSFCRWADDLGDEIGDKQESLRLLAWWRQQLDEMYEGDTEHPVFIALRGTAQNHALPKELFADLIHAFVQDQHIGRYQTWDEVLEYCRYSANPVGRLLLHLCGYRDSARAQLSDCTCTALQLANHWQDVSIDLLKDRVYVPLEIMRLHDYSLEDLFARRENAAFRAVIRELVKRTRPLFEEGLPLIRSVNRRLALDLDLFSRGGMRVLDKIEKQDYKVLHRRPAISKTDRALLLLGSLARVTFLRAA
jgi:squalene synthase HpnC